MSLVGKGAVVTGGGRGIGAAIARALAEAGAAVVVSARTEGQIEQVAKELTDAGHQATAIRCDVTDAESITELARRTADRLEHVDILINNAGVASSAPLHKIELEEWNRVLSTNATGMFLCTKAFAPGMLQRGWGRIINITSTAGLTGGQYIAAYSASKHAVIGFTRSIAEEVAAAGVTINAVCPGFVDTDMTDESIARIVKATGMSRREALDHILTMSPQRRLIEVEEVAHAALSLCDEKAGGINGQCIVIDGGSLRA